MTNRTKQPSDHLQTLESYYKPRLSKVSYNQLQRAFRNPPDRFWTEVLLPNLVIDPSGRPVGFDQLSSDAAGLVRDELEQAARDEPDISNRPDYICLSSTKKLAGRSQFSTLDYLTTRSDSDDGFVDPRGMASYFTNYIGYGFSDDETFNRPSKRVAVGPFTFFTIEIDPPSDWSQQHRVEFLEKQLAWLRKSKDGEKSRPIYDFLKWLKQFSDFRAMVVSYSGNKSLHFTFGFDTSSLMGSSDGLHGAFRNYYRDCFKRLSEAFDDVMLPGILPDAAMRFPEQFRRLPNGTSVIEDQKKHIFDLPTGTKILQATLFEDILKKAPGGADRAFLNALELKRYTTQAKPVVKAAGGKSQPAPVWMNDDEHRYCHEQLDVLIKSKVGPDGYPKLAGLEIDSRLIARLYANQFDQNPNIILFGDSNRPFACGGQRADTQINIGTPLRYHIQRWQRSWRRLHPGQPDAAPVPDFTAVQVIEPALDEAPIDEAEARTLFASQFSDLMDQHDILLVQGSEGFGKTTQAMRMLPSLAKSIIRNEMAKAEAIGAGFECSVIGRQRSAFATASYDQAVEKCAAFNDLHNTDATLGIVFRSFNACYDKALEKVFGNDWHKQKFTTASAADDDQKSVIRAIQSRQSDVWTELASIHAEMFEPVRQAKSTVHVVLFMVHDVLHQWTEGGLSPLFSHSAFFETEVENLWSLKEDTALVVAVQDEVARSHFLTLEPMASVQWCEALFETGGPWSEDSLHLGEAKKSWLAHDAATPGTVEFADTIRIFRSEVRSNTHAGVGPIERYGANESGMSWPMFEERHIHQYAYRKRSWWKGLARKTIILTTEGLPTELFRQATIGLKSAAIYKAVFPMMSRGRLEAHVLPSLSASENATLVGQMRDTLGIPELHAICNNQVDILDSTSIPKAKGSNELADRNIIQIANFVSPSAREGGLSEYDELQVINLVFGIRNAIRLHHVDQINQVAGRNLGHRYQSNRHVLMISKTLWNTLQTELMSGSRYALDLIKSADIRRNQTHSKERSQIQKLAMENKDYDGLRDYEYDCMQDELDRADVDRRLDEATAELYYDEN